MGTYTRSSWPQQYTEAGFPASSLISSQYASSGYIQSSLADKFYQAGQIYEQAGYGSAQSFYNSVNTSSQPNQGYAESGHSSGSAHYDGGAIDIRNSAGLNNQGAAYAAGAAGLGVYDENNHLHISESQRASNSNGGDPRGTVAAWNEGRNSQGNYESAGGDPRTDNNIPSNIQSDGYTQSFYDGGQKYYYNPETDKSIGYDAESRQWVEYNATTGEATGNTNSEYGAPPASYNATTPSSTGGAGGAGNTPSATPGGNTPEQASGATTGANAQKGQEIGGAGCMGSGQTPAKLAGAAGLMQGLGGVAQGALMAGAQSILSGAGIQGMMGSMLGAAGGALGNSLGASLGGVGGAFLGQTLGGAVGALVAGGNPLQALSGAAFGALSQMGGSLLPALSNVMPAELAQGAMSGLQAGLGALAKGQGVDAAFNYALAGGLGGTIQSYVNNMTGNSALASTLGAVASGVLNGTIPGLNSSAGGGGSASSNLQYANIISQVAASSNGNRELVGAIAEAASLKFGPVNGGYGAKVRNMQDAMTFSITTLGQNVNAISADMIAMGTWDASNPMRFMQAGNVCKQIMDKGLSDLVGLTDELIKLKLPVMGIDNPLFDHLSLQALDAIDDQESINYIKTAFSMTVNFSRLSDLTDISIMMPTSKQYMPIHNFREFGVQLAIIGLDTDTNVREIGMAFSKIETATDLNHLSQMQSPLSTDDAAVLMQVYGYGGGSFGEQTMADFIGTAAGYVHSDTIPIIKETSEYVTRHPAAATLNDLTAKLTATITGKYTDLGIPGDQANGIPDTPGSIKIPGIGEFQTLDDAILAFIPLIEAEHVNIMNDPDPILQDQLKKLDVAYRASVAQLVRENNNLIIHDINLFDETPVQPMDALLFMDNLESWALQTGYGGPADYIERVATDDVYGNCVKYVMRQARNAEALEGLGINIEQHRVPQSQYYREPELFYQNLYTGSLPATPSFRVNVVRPTTPADTYTYLKNQTLTELGYSEVPLTQDQTTEIYINEQWSQTPQAVSEAIGRTVVAAAITENTNIVGEDLLITNLDGITVAFGKVKSNGLILLNNEYFIATMMEIVSKMLYGNIRVSSYSNPYNTDQMIFGVVELLAQVTNQNVDALMRTVTGGLIAGGLLSKIMQKFSETRSITDTSMTRNEPVIWGDSGAPGSQL